MISPIATLPRRLARIRDGERGTTLLEVVVGMTIMSIFMSMFTGAVVMMTRAENKAEAVSQTSLQLNQAFLTLDKTVRYAAAISDPGVGASGDWYVELRTTNNGVTTCTQLRVDIGSTQLQRRTWTVAGGVATNVSPAMGSAPQQIAVGIINGGVGGGPTDQPFVLKPPADNVYFQQLTVNLISLSGGSSATTSRSSFAFTALNSTVPAPTPVCNEVPRL